jgi:hypothetical protein
MQNKIDENPQNSNYLKLFDYFNFLNDILSKNSSLKKVYILNNSSCDMDSFISSITLSLAKNFSEKIIKLNSSYILNSNLNIQIMKIKFIFQS